MQIQAAVVHDRGAPFQIETVELTDPVPDELIVRDLTEALCQAERESTSQPRTVEWRWER